jgi:hypothetical protein
VAPDYLHKANVTGGMPYGLAVPNPGADGLLLWEPHQTTFVNYLRIAFGIGGMPGWQHEPALFEHWALPRNPAGLASEPRPRAATALKIRLVVPGERRSGHLLASLATHDVADEDGGAD